MSHHNAKNAQNNPPPDLRRDRRAEESTKRHVYVEPGVKIDLVEDLRKEYDASQRKSATHNEKQLFWTKVAAGLLTLTALFAFWQAYFANRTAKIALIDQRPFLVV